MILFTYWREGMTAMEYSVPATESDEEAWHGFHEGLADTIHTKAMRQLVNLKSNRADTKGLHKVTHVFIAADEYYEWIKENSGGHVTGHDITINPTLWTPIEVFLLQNAHEFPFKITKVVRNEKAYENFVDVTLEWVQ